MIGRKLYIRRLATKLQKARAISTSGGRVYTEGNGLFGALGRGDNLDDSKVFEITAAAIDSSSFIPNRVVAGWGHSIVVTDKGSLLAFGRPYDFGVIMQLNRLKTVAPSFARAVGKFTHYFGGGPDGLITIPTPIEGLIDVVSASCGAGLTISMTGTGDVFAFGQNRWGQCGIGDSKRMHLYSPEKVALPAPVSAADAGLQHCVALTRGDGQVYTWGKGNRGQLGSGDTDSFSNPIRVNFGREFKDLVTSVSAGFSHTAALTAGGSVYLWGKGMSERIKIDEKKSSLAPMRVYEDQLTPRKVTLPDNRKAVEICTSNFNLVIRCSDNSLWALGLGEYDRSTCAFPLRVQQAGGADTDTAATGTSDTSNSDDDNASAPPSSGAEGGGGGGEGESGLLTQSGDAARGQRRKQEGKYNKYTSQRTVGGGGVGTGVGVPESPLDPPVVMPATALLRKGFNRVTIISEGLRTGLVVDPSVVSENSNTASASASAFVYEVIVHAGEAYLKRKNVSFSVDQGQGHHNSDSTRSKVSGDDDSPSPPRVIDFSTGWQHSIAIIA